MLVRDLGCKPLPEVLTLQRSLVRRRALGEVPDTLLLAQHPSVYTRGAASRRKPGKRLPFPLHAVEREGGLCYHGPGQLVGYPVFHLGGLGLSPSIYRRSLAAVLVEALRPLGVKAVRRQAEEGLWAQGKRLMFIGIAVRDRISCHGFALNINCDLAPFRPITPRGDTGWTSLQELLGQPQDEAMVAKTIAEAFLRYF